MGLVPQFKQLTITTSGTPQPILVAADGIAQSDIVSCTIQPATNVCYVGDSTISATASPPTGIALASATKDKFTVTQDNRNVIDLGQIYVDASVNGSKVNILILYRK